MTYTWHDGKSLFYIGERNDEGQAHGRGTKYDRQGAVTFDGWWAAGQQDGPANPGDPPAEGPRPPEDDGGGGPRRPEGRDFRRRASSPDAELWKPARTGPSKAPLQGGKAVIADEDFEEFSFRPQKRQN
eukprot:3456350-Rhodomonas_salina.1